MVAAFHQMLHPWSVHNTHWRIQSSVCQVNASSMLTQVPFAKTLTPKGPPVNINQIEKYLAHLLFIISGTASVGERYIF